MPTQARTAVEPDLFDLLDISLREDSYTALIWAARRHTPGSAQASFALLADGSVTVPAALRAYMGGMERIGVGSQL